ncbi:22351_t:CDS:2, partial [Gigaspora margarita]
VILKTIPIKYKMILNHSYFLNKYRSIHLYPGDAGAWMQELQAKYGDMFEVYLGSNRAIGLCRSDLVEKLMSSSTTNTFRLRTPVNDGVEALGMMDKGIIFNHKYDDWSYIRRFYSKILATPQARKKIVESSQTIFTEIEKCWKESDESIIDLTEWIIRFAFENIMYLATNMRVNSIDNYHNSLKPNTQTPLTEKFVGGVRMYLHAAHFYALAPTFWRNKPGQNKAIANMLLGEKKSLDLILLEMVKKRRVQIENSDVSEELSQDFLTQLLTVNTKRDVTKGISDEKHQSPMSDEEIKAIITEIFTGGAFTVKFRLSKYPEVQQKIVQEIESILGKNLNKEVTLKDIDNMKYCEAVINEVARIWPTFPVNLRASDKQETIASYTFAPNTQFLINNQAIHLHPKDWEDPNKFKPERFLDGEKINKNAFFMFGGGTRICPARVVGLTEMKMLMIMLFQKYNVELVEKDAPIKYQYAMIRLCSELKLRII